MQVIKRKAGLPISTENNIMTHEGFVGIKGIWQNQLEHHIPNLIKRINSDKADGRSTVLRIMQAQLDLNMSQPIFQYDKNTLGYYDLKGNLAFQIIKEAAQQHIHIRWTVDPELIIHGQGLETRIVMKQITESKLIPNVHKAYVHKALNTLSRLGIFYINDMLTPDGQHRYS
jgi:hypothetical protein